MVLVVISILTIMVVSFTDTTQKHLYVTQYYKDRLQAYQTAQSGLQALTAVLRQSSLLANMGNYDSANSPWHFESEAYQMVVLPLLVTPVCGSSLIEPALQVPAMGTTSQRTYLIDENSKLSLYHLINNWGGSTEKTNEVTFFRVMALLDHLLLTRDLIPPSMQNNTTTLSDPGLDMDIDTDTAERLAYYLIDWIDTENNKSVDYNKDIAEDHCPEDNLPYITKNGRLDSIDEIGMVCGFRQMGRPVIEKISRHLTDYNLVTNINTVSRWVLTALFDAAGSDDPETNAEDIYPTLHRLADGDPVEPITETNKIKQVLIDRGIEEDVAKELARKTSQTTIGVQSDHFQLGISGAVYDTESGTEQARSQLHAVIKINKSKTSLGSGATLMYYRED